MSTLTYNGETLGLILTKSVAAEPVYDQSQTDLVGTKVTISVQSLFNQVVDGEDPARRVARLRHTLLEPRKTLSYTVNGTPVVSSGPTTDLKHGPHPRSCSITQVRGSQSMLVDYVVETTLAGCPAGTGSGSAILSHRWKDNISVDETGYSTRTRTGYLVLRGGTDPNSALPAVVQGSGGIPNGFKRVKADYTVSEDGLQVLYVLVDREQFLQPPPPAFKASGEYIESSPNHGARRFGEVRVRLEGNKANTKGDLLSSAVKICMSKVTANGQFGPEKGTTLQSATVREGLWENWVEVSIKAEYSKSSLGFVGMDLARMGRTLALSNGNAPPNPGVLGSSQLGLIAAAVGDPCLAAAGTSSLRTAGALPMGVGGNAAPTIAISNFPSATTNALYAGGDQGIYGECRISSYYERKRGIAQLEVAGNNPSLSSTAFVQLSNGSLRLVVEWKASREGAQPSVPSPASTDPNLVLLEDTTCPMAPETAGDGTRLRYRWQGRFVYGVKDPGAVSIAGGNLPWMPSSLVSADPPDFATNVLSTQGTNNILGNLPLN